jgi:hypothetical protein
MSRSMADIYGTDLAGMLLDFFAAAGMYGD